MPAGHAGVVLAHSWVVPPQNVADEGMCGLIDVIADGTLRISIIDLYTRIHADRCRPKRPHSPAREQDSENIQWAPQHIRQIHLEGP